MSTVTTPSTINGVNVEQLGANVNAIQGKPDLAKFQFRATNTWINGGHNQTTIKGFYGVGQEDTTRTAPFMLVADEPPVLLGEDHGANPVEFVLHALAACLTTSMVYHAAARGIKIDAIESHLEGDLDIRGFLNLSKEVRPGYENLRVRFTVKSDAPAEILRELSKHSPVFDIVTNSVPVAIEVATSQS
ncbi:MAG: OsmC family protein [Nitrospirales bacterium]|nr:OsmC family protein [Nitrospirales bacterium]